MYRFCKTEEQLTFIKLIWFRPYSEELLAIYECESLRSAMSLTRYEVIQGSGGLFTLDYLHISSLCRLVAK